jgi:plasmid stabilization system protein ParE
MAEVRWTPQAADDLEAITAFIAKDSASYAKLFANKINWI